jgi:transcription initiation factor IIE alpha subunit
MNENSNPHSVRRIVLPSGRCIEVVRFHDAEETVRPGLHLCPDCESDLVQPVTWAEASDDQWELVLSCPNCGWDTEGVFSQDQVQELEEKLDEGLADMLRDLQRLTQANMSDQIERFCAALHADLILPEDF